MRKRTAIITTIMLVIQLILTGSSGLPTALVNAHDGMPMAMNNGQGMQMQMGRTTRAQREAAAARAATARQLMGPSSMDTSSNVTTLGANPSQTPDYFGISPNYANSPLPPTVTITGGGGIGATAVATVQAGVVTSILVTNGGSGYTATPTISISPIISTITNQLGDGTGASATATISSGAVTAIAVTNGGSGYSGIRKFVDSLPGSGATNANDLGQYIPVAIPDTTTYPGSDYYEIELREYTEQLHKDLPLTTMRGYVQVNTSDLTVSKPSYLGPTIVAQRNRPVRVKFTNKLPIGNGGNLFIPVDTTAMGAGTGPLGGTEQYSQNRATLHLHGGVTPWISDGTPHQWTTPATQTTSYPKGVSVQNVPDMPDPGPGALTFFYTNQQSARLMFYHDHTYGLTRLNVYAGEAAGYIVQDQVEQNLVTNGTIPANSIPLIIQDKTFVPGPKQLAVEDPTWAKGGLGKLWFPHVYMPNQNPADMFGTNAMGRWDYGPWFWPPTTNLMNGPLPNPYYVAGTSEGAVIPGMPNPSLVPEGFMDTPLVNGTAYPFLPVGQKTYRFRILNASNDRSINLQLYYAKSNNTMWDTNGNLSDPNAGEVNMVVAAPGQGLPDSWPTDGREGGAPDPLAVGPPLIQIGTEGGVLPAPVVLPNQPITYEYERRSITVLNVFSKNLFLGPAERADIIVDFSQVPDGSKLILYNDSPSPVPAFDTRYDYYTGDSDQTSTGGAPTTLPGYGPNTRTIMQFQVSSALGTGAQFDLPKLQTALPAAFAQSQDPIIVPESAYNAVYSKNFTDTYSRIQDTQMTFTPIGGTAPLTLSMGPKAIQELFETDYGRMNATFGVEIPNTNARVQTTIPYGYIDPPTEIIQDSMTPMAPIAGDGTQIWKITHNGVDTHAIHFHLFNVQLINRVGWDGVVKPPDANELGWKETVRMNPLEDAIVAMRPIAPKTPFGIADSIHPFDVTMPLGSTMGFANVDPNNNPITVVNQLFNFGDEYVWHCHLLGHEENDMMRSIVFNELKTLPAAPVISRSGSGSTVVLNWTDATPALPALGQPGSNWGNSANEIGFQIMRAIVPKNWLPGAYTQIGTALANKTTYTDTTATAGVVYSYKVVAFNAAGGADSNAITVGATQAAGTAPKAPTQLQVIRFTGTSITLGWNDNANNELGFIIERSANGRTWTRVTTTGANVRTYIDTGLSRNTTYWYRVQAYNSYGTSTYAGPISVTTRMF